MLLIELAGNVNAPTFGPTKKFFKVYGNYGGPGNRGGDPIDQIDAACRDHDMCYHYQGRDNRSCDLKLVKNLEDQLKKKLTFKQRTGAQLMMLYFKRKLAHQIEKGHEKPPEYSHAR